MSTVPDIPWQIFKAYDIRGRYPRELNERVMEVIGAALGRSFGRGRVIVARDGRRGSEPLLEALARGLRRGSRRVRVVRAGLATIPMFTFLVNTERAAGGAMVTASHNPKEWNGLKMTRPNGVTIGGNEMARLVKRYMRSL